ncbi:MAG TPA: SRPBCC domain-containing protein [Marmoricola sp.]|nr:SRPBCC domain-containing protein [Marmoricola sp.]
MKNLDDAKIGTIERELYIEASPETVFEVVSRPEYVAQWWPDTAAYEVEVDATGEITFGDPASGGKAVTLTVMEVDPPNTFSFRWTHEADDEPAAGNSLFVTFALTPSGIGTLLRFTETGFREMGWEEAVCEATFNDHANGWNSFLPRLARYAEQVVVSR